MATKPKPPEFLATEGRRIWIEILKTYDLRADELLTLEDICAASDLIADLRKQWMELGRPTITKGSMGQEVEHPLIGSIDKAQKARNALWRQLKLPDPAAGGVGVNAQREGGNTRWANAHGR